MVSDGDVKKGTAEERGRLGFKDLRIDDAQIKRHHALMAKQRRLGML